VVVLNDVPPVVVLYHAKVPTGLVGATAINVTLPVPHLEPLVTVGLAGCGFLVDVTLLLIDLHPVVKFRCTAQYKVVVLNEGVTYLFTPVTVPDCNKLVAKESEYQLMVIPVNAVAEMVEVSVPHFVAFTTVATAVGKAFKVAVTAVLVEETQVPLLASA